MKKKRVVDSSRSHFTAKEVAALGVDEDELADLERAVDLFVEFGSLVNPDVLAVGWVAFAKKVIAFALDKS